MDTSLRQIERTLRAGMIDAPGRAPLPRLRWGRALLTGLMGGVSTFLALSSAHVMLPYLDDPERARAELIAWAAPAAPAAPAEVETARATVAEPCSPSPVTREGSMFRAPPTC